MSEIITKDYNGVPIEFELIDGQLMANATVMCAAFGKRPAKWLELESTRQYIAALGIDQEALSGKRTLVETRNGGSNPGTWIREDLILELAGWLNVAFKIQCHKWVAELLRTGRVELAPLSPEELMVQYAQALLDHSRRLKVVEAGHIHLQQQVNEVVAKQTTIDTNYYTVAGWASKEKLKKSTQELTAYGRRAAALSREQGYRIGQAYDAKYVTVGTYHIDILKQTFSQPLPASPRGQCRPTARR